MPTNLFSVRIEDWDKKRNRLLDKETLNSYSSLLGNVVAVNVREKFQELLGKKKVYSGAWAAIGASGKAAENFTMKEGKNVAGFTEWQVWEGNSTPANYYIRSGFRGHPRGQGSGSSGGGGGAVIKKLRLWAAQKGITLKLGKATLKYVAQHSRSGKEYARVMKGAKESDIVLSLIRKKLWYTGSAYTNWRDYPPKNRGKFDYVAYAMKFTSRYEGVLNEIGSDMVRAYADYLASGKRPTMGKTWERRNPKGV